MAIPGDVFAKMSLEEIAKIFPKKLGLLCACGAIAPRIHYVGGGSGYYYANGKPSCEDCHFDAMGEEVEKHPIGLPRMHKGKENYTPHKSVDSVALGDEIEEYPIGYHKGKK